MMTDLTPATYAVTRDDLVAYAAASGDPNPIHQDPDVARSVGLPDVIAHGMFTLALAARYVDEQLGEPGRIVELGAKFTKPVVVPEDGTEVAVDGTWRDERTIALKRHLRRRDRPRQPGGGRACLSPRLGDHTTLRLGGPARAWVRATTDDELVDAVRRRRRGRRAGARAGRRQQPGRRRRGVRRHRRRGGDVGRRADVEDDDPTCGGVVVKVAAGECWDDLVATAVERRWVGVEALSGIPGSVGATPIQNVGAYGQEVSQTLARVRVWDRRLRGIRTFAAADCGFGYRTSRFKADPVAPRRPRGHLPVPAGRARRAGRLCRAGPHPRRRAGRPRSS